MSGQAQRTFSDELSADDSTSPLEAMVRKLGVWKEFDAKDRAALLALPHTVRPLKAGEYIVRQSALAHHSCVMLSGFSVRHKFIANGGRQIVAIQMKDDVVDLQNALLGKADHSVQMLTRGSVAIIHRGEIKRIAFERPTIGEAMWIDTLVDASISREWIANVGRRNAETRMAHLFCEFALRLKLAGLGQEDQYDLPMSQEQLADTTGLTPVHVNRTIRLLEAKGLIRRETPKAISIDNWERLAEAGDFDTEYLHLHARRRSEGLQ